MSKQSSVTPPSAKLKNAILWMAEMVREQPDKTRLAILQEAELRFDLTPAESAFLEQNFSMP